MSQDTLGSFISRVYYEPNRLGATCRVAKCQFSYTEQNIPTKFYPNSIISILIIIEWMHAHSHDWGVGRKRDKNKDLNPMLSKMLTIDLLKRNHCGFSKVILNGS